MAISSLQLLLIMAFLANLREADEWKWMISFLVVLARKMLIVPLLACMFSSIGTELAALTQPSFASKPPKQMLSFAITTLGAFFFGGGLWV